MKPLIKWPGGKSSEIVQIERMIPVYKRYVEPFFGGGALFFDLMPDKAVINDVSDNLMNFYKLVKEDDQTFRDYLNGHNNVWKLLLKTVQPLVQELTEVYKIYRQHQISDAEIETLTTAKIDVLLSAKKDLFDIKILLDFEELKAELNRMCVDKLKRTKKNEIANAQLLADEDLQDNILTGFTSGLYMHFRNIYNKLNTGNNHLINLQYKIANFYFIREYCYGSMFRYNSKGEFNIPYGGISYNKKDFGKKIEQIFSQATVELFRNTDISNRDFADFLESIDLREEDFVFLDPPYDSDFSDYEGRAFGITDQQRLAEILKTMRAKFILIIKNTDFINALYHNTDLHILAFDKNYTYNVRSRNERNVEHLIITNLACS